MRLLIFGWGYSASAVARRLAGSTWTISATSRDFAKREQIAGLGVDPLDPGDLVSLARAAREADAILVCAPPGADGCPALAALSAHLGDGRARWLGYLSTTGVYGDRGGGWVDERTPPDPLASDEAARRIAAEDGWRTLVASTGAALCIFRLAGIYGPGRSAFDRLQAGDARRIVKPGQVFSRIHAEDLASAVAAGLARDADGVFNLCDDQPAPATDVTLAAARLADIEPPPEEPFDPAALSPAAVRFWSQSRRVANARAKAALGWRPAYPTYREGLAAILEARRA